MEVFQKKGVSGSEGCGPKEGRRVSQEQGGGGAAIAGTPVCWRPGSSWVNVGWRLKGWRP